jgi:hypothetical protein
VGRSDGELCVWDGGTEGEGMGEGECVGVRMLLGGCSLCVLCKLCGVIFSSVMHCVFIECAARMCSEYSDFVRMDCYH